MNSGLNGKIAETSNDEVFSRRVELIIGLLENLSIEYTCFGSCAIQSYFPNFFRLPNDLDLLMSTQHLVEFKRYCISQKATVEEKNGRLKLVFNKLTLNVISEFLDVIVDADGSSCGTIELVDFPKHSKKQDINLYNATTKPVINVLSLEYLLFLELFRAVNTNSIFTIFYIFSSNLINTENFIDIVSNQSIFRTLIIVRIEEYISKLSCMSNLLQPKYPETISKLSRFHKALTK